MRFPAGYRQNRTGQSPETRKTSHNPLLTPHQPSPNPSGEDLEMGENGVEILIFSKVDGTLD